MKFIKVLLTLCVVAFMFSCAKDDQNDLIAEPLESEDLIADALCGYDYHLQTLEGAPGSRHDTWDATVPFNPCDLGDLWICVEPCFVGTDWECAINAAADAYNALPDNIGISMNVTFDCSTIPAGETANIRIECATLGLRNTGRTWSRASPYGTSRIELNMLTPTNWLCGGVNNATCCQLTRTVMHEMGHALGMGHSDPGNTINANGTQNPETYIPGTQFDDLNSVFITGNRRRWCDDNCDFSPGDIHALGLVFPEPSIEGPSGVCAGGTVEFCVSEIGNGANTRVTWTLNNVNSTVGNCKEYRFADPGTYTISAEASEDGCTWNLSKTVTVYDCEDGCFCICEVWEEGASAPYDRAIEVPCIQPLNCDDLLDDAWDEELVNKNECRFTTVDPCFSEQAPTIRISGPDEMCKDEKALICISGFNAIKPMTWTITDPFGTETRNTNSNCLYYDFEEIGTVTISAEVCYRENCCQTLSITVEVKQCSECYCECKEGDGRGGYTIVQMPIECNEDCDEKFSGDDEYDLWDCVLKER